jgi:hypothetical protein
MWHGKQFSMDGPVRRWLIVVCSVFVKGTGRERSYNPTMLGRSARKYLTPQQELIASQHFARLLKRWAWNLNQSRSASQDCQLT